MGYQPPPALPSIGNGQKDRVGFVEVYLMLGGGASSIIRLQCVYDVVPKGGQEVDYINHRFGSKVSPEKNEPGVILQQATIEQLAKEIARDISMSEPELAAQALPKAIEDRLLTKAIKKDGVADLGGATANFKPALEFIDREGGVEALVAKSCIEPLTTAVVKNLEHLASVTATVPAGKR